MTKNRTPSLNISQQFLGYLLFLSVLPVLLVGIMAYRNASDVLRTESIRNTTQLVNNQRDYLDLQANQLQNLLLNLSGVDTIRKALTTSDKANNTYTNLSTQAQIGYILNGYTNLTGLASIDIFSVSGAHYHVGDTLNAEQTRDDVKQAIISKVTSSDQLATWIGVEDNVNSNSSYKKVVVAAKGIFQSGSTGDAKPVLVGVIVVNYSVDALYQHFSQVDIGKGAFIQVIDGANRLIYTPDNTQIGTLAPSDVLAALGSSGTTTASLNGTETSVSFTTSSLTGWKIASFTPVSIFAEQTASIGVAILLTLVLCFVIVALAAWSYNGRVVRPIREITVRFKALQNNSTTSLNRLNDTDRMTPRGRDEIGQLVLWFNSFLDSLLTRQRAEQRLREREIEREQLIQELEESLKFKDQFLATMSHELRTPLNAIQGYSVLIDDEQGISDDIHYMIERILSNSERLLHLINDVLDISRINAQRIELIARPITLHELIWNWYSDFKLQAEAKKLALELSIDPDLPTTIIGDEARLTQIVANLIQNALKFTDEGKLTIAASRHESKWSITVSDTGIGIAEGWQHLIFDEFRQVDGSSRRKYGGAGLGLSIVKKLSLLMGGTVTVSSQLGQGSAFTVMLPLKTAILESSIAAKV